MTSTHREGRAPPRVDEQVTALTTSQTGTQDSRPKGDRRPAVARDVRALVVAAMAVLAMALVAALVWVAARPAPVHDRGTPEGVVQQYVTAILGGDAGRAAGLLTPGGPCSVADLDGVAVPRGASVDLVDTRITGTTALVRIRVVTDAGGGPFGGAPGEVYVLRLTRSGVDWRLDGSPWPLFGCRKD